jgi:large conductance mechanosensitive channel
MKERKGLVDEFKEFAAQGDAFALAIGIIIGTGFKDVVTSFVNNIVLPPINFLTSNIDFTELELVLRRDLVIEYGTFLNDLIVFLVTALVVFLFIYKFQQFAKREKRSK